MVMISVIMSVGYKPKLLKKTVDSVLNQTYEDFEFLIVDDSCKQSVKNELKKFKNPKIRIIWNKKPIGLTKSLNKALKISKGKYIARIDNGDICRKDRFRQQLAFMTKYPKVAVVGSDVNVINTKGKIIGYVEYPSSNKEIKNGLLRTNLFAHSTLFFRKNILDTEGFYDEEFYYAQDYELLLRIAAKYSIGNIKEKLVDYLFDEKGITLDTSKRKKQDKFALQAKKKAIEEYGYENKKDYLISKIEALVPMNIKRSLLRFINRNKEVNLKGKKMFIKTK